MVNIKAMIYKMRYNNNNIKQEDKLKKLKYTVRGDRLPINSPHFKILSRAPLGKRKTSLA